jgi:uncharacterized protein DUF6412
MVLWGFWVVATLLAPATLLGPAPHPSALVLTLAVAAAALLVVAIAALPAPTPAGAPGVRAFARRSRTAALPRLLDPDAAGRPRPRAPASRPAAA